VKYRGAVPEDAPACVALRGMTRENAVSAERLRECGITPASWAGNIRTGALPGHVCTSEGRLVAYCFGSRSTGEIEVLAVLPDFENRGIGRELLERTCKDLAKLGHRRAFLGCSPDPRSRSHGFYRRLGWRPTGEFDSRGDELLERPLDREEAETPNTSDACGRG
jgi:GNAT superfamily N-acetyltransferase